MTKNKMIKKLMLLIPLTAMVTQLNATNQFIALNVKDFVRTFQGKTGISPKQYKEAIRTLSNNMQDDDLILVTPKTNNQQFDAPYSITFTKSNSPVQGPATKALIHELYSEQYQLNNLKPLIINIANNGTLYEKTLLNIVTATLSDSELLDDQDPITNIQNLQDTDYGKIAAEYAYYYDEEPWFPKLCNSYDKKRELPTNVPTITQGILFSKAQLLQQLEDTYTDQAFNKIKTSQNGFVYQLKKRNDSDPLQQKSFLYQLARHGAIAHIKAPAQGNATLQIPDVQVDAIALTSAAQAILAEMAQAQNYILQDEDEVQKKLNAWDKFIDTYTANLKADDQSNGQLAQHLGVKVTDNTAATLVTELKKLYTASYKPGIVIQVIEKMMDQVQPPQKATEQNAATTPTTATGDNQQYDDTLKRIQEQQ